MNQQVQHKTTLTSADTVWSSMPESIIVLFSTFFPIHHKIKFDFYSWVLSSTNLQYPGQVSAASPQLYYATFTCTNNLGFNWTAHARKSFVRRWVFSYLPSGPQGQQKAITNVPKLWENKEEFFLLAKYTHADSSQRERIGVR